MAILGKIAANLIGGIIGGPILGGIFGGGKKAPEAAGPLPVATRDDAAAEAERSDRLRRRRGAAADMIVNGSSGAEAAMSSPRMIVGS